MCTPVGPALGWRQEDQEFTVVSYSEFEASLGDMRPCLKANIYPEETFKDSLGLGVEAVLVGPFVGL